MYFYPTPPSCGDCNEEDGSRTDASGPLSSESEASSGASVVAGGGPVSKQMHPSEKKVLENQEEQKKGRGLYNVSSKW